MELSLLFLLTSVHMGERGHSALGIMELEAIWFISFELRSSGNTSTAVSILSGKIFMGQWAVNRQF